MKTTRHGFAAFAAVLSLLVAAGGCAFAFAAQKADSVGFRDAIIILADETRSNAVGFGSDIDVRGKVRKSVLAFGGTITVSGEVGEAVVGFGARIVLKDTAVIHGDLVVLGGAVEREPGALVEGDTVNFRAGEIFSKVFGEGFRGLFGISLLPLILVFKVVNLMLWILVGVIAASIYPKQVAAAADQIRKAPLATLGYGLAAQFLFVFAIIIASVLCLVLIGIPLLMGLAVGGFLLKVFGRVAVFFLLGASLSRALGKGTITPVGAAVLGAVVVGLIGFVPILGFLAVGVLSLFGWGTAVRTKFGTMESWLQKKPLPPAAPPTA